jgi:hypothetical protein
VSRKKSQEITGKKQRGGSKSCPLIKDGGHEENSGSPTKIKNLAGERRLEPRGVFPPDPESGESATLAQDHLRKKRFWVRAAILLLEESVQNFTAPAVKPRIRYFWAMKTNMIPGSAAISAPAHI